MQSATLIRHQAHQAHTGLRMKSLVKFAIPVIFLLIAVAIYELNTAQLVMLALVSGLVLALFYRVENMLSADVNEVSESIMGAGMDGGSFHHKKSTCVKKGTVNADGGSFERASSRINNQS